MYREGLTGLCLIALALFLAKILLIQIRFASWRSWASFDPGQGGCLPLLQLAFDPPGAAGTTSVISALASCVLPTRLWLTQGQLGFLSWLLAAFAEGPPVNGFLQPQQLCISIAPLPGNQAYDTAPTVDDDALNRAFGAQHPPGLGPFAGWPNQQESPKATAIDYWRAVLGAWGGGITPVPTLWDQPSNFLYHWYKIPQTAQVVQAFCTQQIIRNGPDGIAVGPEVLATLLGCSGPGGWYNFITANNFGDSPAYQSTLWTSGTPPQAWVRPLSCDVPGACLDGGLAGAVALAFTLVLAPEAESSLRVLLALLAGAVTMAILLRTQATCGQQNKP